MEAEEIEILLKLREGIRNGSWEEVTDAWNEISGESLLPPDTRSPQEKLQRQIQDALGDNKKELMEERIGEVVPDIKNDDIVRIEILSDDKKEVKKKRNDGPKRRQTGVPDSLKKEDGDARYHDEIPDHIKNKKQSGDD